MAIQQNTIETIDVLLRSGMMGKNIASQLNVSPAYISKVKKELSINQVRHMQIERAGQIVDKHIDAADQLAKVNTAANRILDRLTDHIDNGKDLPPENQRKDSMELVARYCQEIRAQLSLQMDIYKSLYDIKVIAAFQQSVLEAINEVAPEVKDRIVQKLKEARAIRPNLQL